MEISKTEQLKEFEVKRIFFRENELLPNFELENGEIKRAYFLNTQQGVKTLWYTEKEFAEANRVISEANKTRLKTTPIIGLNGKSLKT